MDDLDSEELHVPKLKEESEGDSDEELQVAFASGLLKSGLVRPITAPPPVINNEAGLLQKLDDIAHLDLDWVERLDVTVACNVQVKMENGVYHRRI
ncbi:putative rRNA-processing protein EBP2 homolog [Ciona intestinalis]